MKYFSSLFYTLLILFISSFSCVSEDSSPTDINDPKNLISQYPEGSIFGPEGPTKIVDVTNPITGNTWMDRNLGATEAAISSNGESSFGYLYQWGRRSDGHQLRTSAISSTLSSTRDTPPNSPFILAPKFPNDWKTPQFNGTQNSDVGLWQGVNGKNNPCPKGYRLPTQAEWEAEIKSWKNKDASGAISSPIKLPAAGFRSGDPNFGFPTDGSITFRGFGLYWSSEEYKGAVPIPGGKTFLSSRLLLIGLSSATMIGEWYNPTLTSSSRGARSIGASCRCIKD